jgi:uronate dehydrogenase
MKKVCITGAAGIIGSILRSGLEKKYELLLLDKRTKKGIKRVDLSKDYRKLEELLRDIDVVIHLAWNTKESCNSSFYIPENRTMANNILRACLENKVKRVIIASSVHVAMGYFGWPYDHKKLHSKKVYVSTKVYPISKYGKSKVYIERLAREYSNRGLEVICARFGHVTKNNKPGDIPFMLFHEDLIQFIDKCIRKRRLSRFSVFYVISNNECNPFDISYGRKILGYKPKLGIKCSNE